MGNSRHNAAIRMQGWPRVSCTRFLQRWSPTSCSATGPNPLAVELPAASLATRGTRDESLPPSIGNARPASHAPRAGRRVVRMSPPRRVRRPSPGRCRARPPVAPRALSAAQQIIATIGAKAITLDAAEHDRILAATSHLPFLLSSALALATPEECAPLVGPGFRSTSRLAGTPSSMMMGVMQTNRENILTALHRLQAQLDALEMQLSSSDFASLESTLDQSHASYHELTTVH